MNQNDSILDRLLAINPKRRGAPREGRAERRAARLIERQREATERFYAERRRRLAKPKPGERIYEKLLMAMQPGEWYGARDVAAVAGVGKPGASRFWQALLPRGFVERTPNPAFVRSWNVKEIEPEWLWRMTPEGERERQRICALRPPSDGSEQSKHAVDHPLRKEGVD